jgi:hypothetical protein
MSDTTETDKNVTPEPAKQPEPEAKAQPKGDEGTGYEAAFKSLQSEKNRLQMELDALRSKHDGVCKELGTVKAENEGFRKRAAESRIIGLIKSNLPDVSEIDIRGRLAVLAEDGKVNRYAPDEEAEAAASVVLENFKATSASNNAPVQKRPPAQGGGPTGAPVQSGRKQYKPLI